MQLNPPDFPSLTKGVLCEHVFKKSENGIAVLVLVSELLPSQTEKYLSMRNSAGAAVENRSL